MESETRRGCKVSRRVFRCLCGEPDYLQRTTAMSPEASPQGSASEMIP